MVGPARDVSSAGVRYWLKGRPRQLLVAFWVLVPRRLPLPFGVIYTSCPCRHSFEAQEEAGGGTKNLYFLKFFNLTFHFDRTYTEQE